MKARTVVTVIIMSFVAAAVAYLVVSEVRKARAPKGSTSEAPVPAAEPATVEAVGRLEPGAAGSPEQVPEQVVVYYFYFGQRCVTCLKIEKYTKDALERGFAEELANGTVVWRPVNTDAHENRHFNDDYGLYAKAVIVSDVRDGEEVRWKNLVKVWQLTGDKGRFMKYIQDEVRAYLTGE